MKTLFIVCMITAFLFSCKKDHAPTPSQSTTGTLRYSDPAADGPGLYFLTDSGLNRRQEFLYFYNDSGDLFSNYDQFKDSIGLHLLMTYLDEGRRGCPFCQVIPTQQQRIVKLISLVKD